MKIETLEGITHWLEQSGNLFEALMHELYLANFGYSVHVGFQAIVRDSDGHVLDQSLDVGFDLEGVQKLVLEGGLTRAMLEHPERINWGLSEVARVRVTPSEHGVQFEALWEGGERRVEIHSRRAILTAPGDPL